jgi:hypothetical protein
VSGAAQALQEAALTSEEVERILRICGPHALLVGGQALAAWAIYYDVQPVGVLSRAVTMDADFIGTKDIARTLHRQLGHPWKVREGTLDDAGGQVAKVYATIPNVGIKQVDFLSGIVGLDTQKIRRRGSELELVDGVVVHVLHPLDVLESRLHNLAVLPSKQNAIGVEQARLAVQVIRAFIGGHMAASGDPKVVRQAVKRVENLALDTALCRVAFTYDIDVLAAIPVERISYSRFHEEQWPRILQRLSSKREKFAALQTRKSALRRPARNAHKK